MQATIAQPLVAQPKSKSSLFPVLVVLFLISYGLLTLLVVEQDHTISSQRILISQLYGDSLQLNALKGKEVQRQRSEAQVHPRGKSQPLMQAPPVQKAPQAGMQNDSSGARRRLLQKPRGIEDNADAHRALNRS